MLTHLKMYDTPLIEKIIKNTVTFISMQAAVQLSGWQKHFQYNQPQSLALSQQYKLDEMHWCSMKYCSHREHLAFVAWLYGLNDGWDFDFLAWSVSLPVHPPLLLSWQLHWAPWLGFQYADLLCSCCLHSHRHWSDASVLQNCHPHQQAKSATEWESNGRCPWCCNHLWLNTPVPSLCSSRWLQWNLLCEVQQMHKL